MLVLVVFAFLSGAVTAITPCVLPMLPALLSASATGGRRRVLGVVIGIAATHTIAIVGLATLAGRVGVADEGLRTVAIAVLAAFGFALLMPQLAARIEAPLSRLARFGPKDGGDGFWSGLAVGGALGLRLRAVRDADTRGGGFGRGDPGRVARARGRRPGVRDRIRARAVRAGVRRPAHRGGHPPRGPRTGAAARARRRHGRDRGGDGDRRRPALPVGARGQPAELDRHPDRGPREHRGRAGPAGRPAARAALPQPADGRRGAAATGQRRRTSSATSAGSTRRTASRCRCATCAARSCWSTSGPTRASTACARCRT